MLQSTSLRLGNLIARAETNEQTGLTTNVPVTVDLEILTAIHNRPNPPYKGIVLTEEWLIKLGFTETIKNYYWRTFFTPDQFSCSIAMRDKDPGGLNKGQMIAGNKNVVVQFVHDLQNVYWSSTGKELKLIE